MAREIFCMPSTPTEISWLHIAKNMGVFSRLKTHLRLYDTRLHSSNSISGASTLHVYHESIPCSSGYMSHICMESGVLQPR